jgi:hypothetical protein
LWDDSCMPPCPEFFQSDGVLQVFFLPKLT